MRRIIFGTAWRLLALRKVLRNRDFVHGRFRVADLQCRALYGDFVWGRCPVFAPNFLLVRQYDPIKLHSSVVCFVFFRCNPVYGLGYCLAITIDFMFLCSNFGAGKDLASSFFV
jgi:hypothetical protein